MPSFTLPAIMTAVSVAGSVAGGIMQNSAAQAQAKQYEFNAQSEKIAADQNEVQRRSDLVATLSTLDAIRTARYLEPTSPTGVAISQNLTAQAERAIGTDRLNYDTKAQYDLFQASAAGMKGTASLLGGFLDAGKTVYSTGQTQGWWG